MNENYRIIHTPSSSLRWIQDIPTVPRYQPKDKSNDQFELTTILIEKENHNEFCKRKHSGQDL
jgi:hypothetical protein